MADPISNDVNFASAYQSVDPNRDLPTWEQQFILDETDAGIENNAKGLWAGFKFPADLGMNDFMAMNTMLQDYGKAVGWSHLPTPQEAMAVYKSGVRNLPDAAKVWGKKLPLRLQYVMYGKSAEQFGQYKLDNRQKIIERFGQHAADNDEAYVKDLANPLQQIAASGGSGSSGQTPKVDPQAAAVR